MSTFVQRFNPLTGQHEWCLLGNQGSEAEYDLRQEVARSSYGSMLHDVDRNAKYYQALRDQIQRLHALGQSVHVLDIGTGTGLLSLMAIRCGADRVAACEAFQPMAECARCVFKDNLSEEEASRLHLVEKRSTDMRLGVDILSKANLLVAEIFDTELIGEGALSSFQHAAENFLTDDATVIPCRAILYIQPLQSQFLRQHFQLQWSENTSGLQVPSRILHCRGVASAWEMQASRLQPQRDFVPLSPATAVKQFHFYPASAIQFEDSTEVRLVAETDGQVDALLVWWDLQMLAEDHSRISCSPEWHRPEDYVWRDHWMQAIYFPHGGIGGQDREVRQGQQFSIHVHHDEYSLWADLSPNHEAPACDCFLHTATSRQRLLALNSPEEMSLHRQLAETLSCHGVRRVLLVAGFSYLPFALALHGQLEVFMIPAERKARCLVESFMEENPQLKHSLHLLYEEDDAVSETDALVAEPHFEESPLEWLNVNFLYRAPQYVTPKVISPHTLRIHAVPVQFRHLHLIREPVRECSGFHLRAFSELVEQCARLVDAPVESHALWEYESMCLASSTQVLELDLGMLHKHRNDPPQELTQESLLRITHSGDFNAIVYWCEWIHVGDILRSSGPSTPCCPGHAPQWKRSASQGVQFIAGPRSVSVGDQLHLKVAFLPKSVQFLFSLLSMTSDSSTGDS